MSNNSTVNKFVASNLAFTTGVNYVSNANTHKRDIPWFRYNTLWTRHQTIKPQKLTTLCGNPGVPAFGVVLRLMSMSFHVNQRVTETIFISLNALNVKY